MTSTEKYIVESYSGLLESLSPVIKLELIEKLVKSIRKESQSKESDFFKSFGAFASEKSPEEIITEIKESRKFRDS